MQLSDLVQALPSARVIGDASIEVGRVRDDSRHVEPGDVFVAVRGMSVDGHDYLDRAIAAGAAAVVVEHPVDLDVVQVVVDRGADALGALASRAAGDPAHRLAMIGITGTNGKTTTTYLLEAILAAANQSPGVIGTVSYRYGGRVVPAPYTTPTPLVLHDVLGEFVAAGCTHGVLETSSAALSMDRLAGIGFRIAAFSNLTQDHLEVHTTMDAYRRAKQRLFADHMAPDGVAVVNVDDPSADAMIAAAGDHRVVRVSVTGEADVYALDTESTIDGIRARFHTPRGELSIDAPALIGHYNVANIAMAVAITDALGIDHDAICRGIASMTGVPGRVERVPNDRGLDILVDYAHTPDALRNVLSALRPLVRRRLICVFGCGGDRDPSKRPKMGAAVSELADVAIVTSDNPRTEQPQDIIDMILPAVPDPLFVHPDRRTAIRAAVAEATPGDIVLIAGKGHEDYQILGTTKIHFDDREEAAAAAVARQVFPLVAVVGEAEATLHGHSDAFSRVIIDGRAAAPGDLYVAIRGETHDGHDFCAQAVSAGATGVMVERTVDAGADVARLTVTDTREAIGAIARWHRRRWRKHGLVGITGSAGKTTTKDLVAAALGAAGPTHRSAGSLNNETGVPLTLLGIRPFHDYAVAEMGMRGLGQIRYLCDIAEPDVGVVVNAGTAHVGVVGSAEAIVEGKSEIFANLPAHGCAVYPAGDDRLAARAAAAPRAVTFGPEEGADVQLVSCTAAGAGGSDLVVAIDGAQHAFRLPLVGHHNGLNAACALAVARALGVAPETAIAGLERARPPALRGQVVEIGGRLVLVDCYNANPAAMDAALATLADLRGDRSAVAVVGDMLELGDEAPAAHRAVGERATALGIATIALGDHAGDVSGATIAADPDAAAGLALDATAPGDWILVKASRGMRLERVVEAMKRRTEKAD